MLGRDVRNTGENRLKSENVSFTYLVVLTDVSVFLFPFCPVVTGFPVFDWQVFLFPMRVRPLCQLQLEASGGNNHTLLPLHHKVKHRFSSDYYQNCLATVNHLNLNSGWQVLSGEARGTGRTKNTKKKLCDIDFS